MSTDALLTDLTSFDDQGNQLIIEELGQIQALSQERLYKWLHSLAGLMQDFTHSFQEQSEKVARQPKFSHDVSQVDHIVSTKSIL